MSLFFTKFKDIKDSLETISQTEMVRPFDQDFNPSNIKAFAQNLGSVYQTAQSYRNLFNNGISPSDIAVMAKSGLLKELSGIVSNNGLSSFFTQGTPFNKTSYSYKDSEQKINSKNLTLNYNPLNIFQQFLERAIRNQSEDNNKMVDDFYLNLNIARRDIFNQNTILYKAISEVIDIHTIHNLERYSNDLQKIFSTDEVFDEAFSIYDQLLNVIDDLHSHVANYRNYLKYIKDKERYEELMEILNSVMSTFGRISTQKELKYAYEDLKNLRKIDDSTVFKTL